VALMCTAATARSMAAWPIVLGSGSATRKGILTDLGLTFEVHKPGIDEKAIRSDDPRELVVALGKAKAAALLEGEHAADFRNRRVLLLTADQVVVCGDQILEKPENEEEARRFIAGYSTTPPRTVGSCVVTDPLTGGQWHSVDEASVIFTPIPEATIDALLAEGEVYSCAGGLMVEHPLVQPHISRLEGGMDSIMGLSKASVVSLLERAISARANEEKTNLQS